MCFVIWFKIAENIDSIRKFISCYNFYFLTKRLLSLEEQTFIEKTSVRGRQG